MNVENISIHSDAIGNLPNDLSFPIINHFGIHLVDLSEQYILNLLQKHTKEHELRNFKGFSDTNLNSDGISSLVKVLNGILMSSDSQNSLSYRSSLNSLISDPTHLNLNDIDFQLSLENYWSKILSFLYKMESKYIIVEIPGINLIRKRVNEPLLFSEKYYQKIQTCFQTLARLANKNDIHLLINYNPNRFIINNPKENLSYQLPFNDYHKFRSFYDGLLNNEENIGLFLDISDYFLIKTPELIQNLIQLDEIQENKRSLNPQKFDEILVRLGHLNDNIFGDIHNIEHLSMMGLNDSKFIELWLKILDRLNINDKVPLNKKNGFSIPLINQIYMDVLKEGQITLQSFKRYLDCGDLPLRAFFSQIHAHTSRMTSNISYSVNPTLKIDNFDLDSIDWRNLDISKIPFKSDVYQNVQQHIKNTTSSQFLKKGEEISSWKKQQLQFTQKNLEVDEKNMLDPPKDMIENMKIFSMKTIIDGIKKYRSFL